jgi:hypothetical protein
MIVFGNATSEAKHNFWGPESVLGSTSFLPLQYPQAVTYRQIGPDPSNTQDGVLTGNQSSMLNVTISVHPVLQTYLTLKLYGSDNQTGAIMMFWRPPQQPANQWLYPGMVNVGAGLLSLAGYALQPPQWGAGYSQLDENETGPNAYPRHFYYATMAIPPTVTNGNTVLNIVIGGWGRVYGYSTPDTYPLTAALKPIYRVYTHLDPFFTPLPSPRSPEQAADVEHYEPHTLEPVPQVPPVPVWDGVSTPVPTNQLTGNLSIIQAAIDTATTNFLNIQAWGPVWNASLNIYSSSNPYAPPWFIYGVFGANVADLTNNAYNYTQWLAWAGVQGYDYLNMIGGLAQTYFNSQSAYYLNQTLVSRIVSVLDFYMYAQGNTGQWQTTSQWCGAPSRIACSGTIDGQGPYSLGLAVSLLIDEIEQGGYLTQLVQPDLDGIYVTRAQAWWGMFAAFPNYVFLNGRGGCPNQDLYQVSGMLLSQAACVALNGSGPLTEYQIQLMINQSLGFAPVAVFPDYGYFFTPWGMVMECDGTLGGGGITADYEGDSVFLLTQLILGLQLLGESGYDYVVERYRNATFWMNHLIYNGFVENNNYAMLGSEVPNNPFDTTHGNPTAVLQTDCIDTRLDHSRNIVVGSGAGVAEYSWYAASEFQDGLSIRLMQVMIANQQWLSLSAPSNPGSYIQLMGQWVGFQQAVLSLYSEPFLTRDTLPYEAYTINSAGEVSATSDSANVDPVGGAVTIHYGLETLFININYRHNNSVVNNLARVFHRGVNESRLATVYFQAWGGFFGLWTLQYGPYFVAINRQQDGITSYAFSQMNYNSSLKVLTELITNQPLDVGANPTLGPMSAWVLVSPICMPRPTVPVAIQVRIQQNAQAVFTFSWPADPAAVLYTTTLSFTAGSMVTQSSIIAISIMFQGLVLCGRYVASVFGTGADGTSGPTTNVSFNTSCPGDGIPQLSTSYTSNDAYYLVSAVNTSVCLAVIPVADTGMYPILQTSGENSLSMQPCVDFSSNQLFQFTSASAFFLMTGQTNVFFELLSGCTAGNTLGTHGTRSPAAISDLFTYSPQTLSLATCGGELCLDTSGTNGASVTAEPCNVTARQSWFFGHSPFT